jgi:hypothetical protein
MPKGCFVPGRALAFVVAAVACLVLGACSPGADYPSLFPAVHDIPPPRSDAPLDANQVQQATEDLITARDRLNTEAQTSQSKPAAKSSAKSSAKSAADPAGKSSAEKSSAEKSSAEKSSAKAATGPAKKPITQVSGRELPGSDGAQTAGAETK